MWTLSSHVRVYFLRFLNFFFIIYYFLFLLFVQCWFTCELALSVAIYSSRQTATKASEQEKPALKWSNARKAVGRHIWCARWWLVVSVIVGGVCYDKYGSGCVCQWQWSLGTCFLVFYLDTRNFISIRVLHIRILLFFICSAILV